MSLVVDVHNHAIPPGFVERVKADGAKHGYTLQEAPIDTPPAMANDVMSVASTTELRTPAGTVADLRPRRTDEAIRQEELSEAGIDLCFEALTPALMAYGGDERQAKWGARAINDGFIENWEAFPDRVVPVAHVPLHHPGIAARELERVAERGIRVVQIASSVNDNNLDTPDLEPFWDAAQGSETLILVHPAPIVVHNRGVESRLSRYHLVNTLGNTFETTTALASLIFGGVWIASQSSTSVSRTPGGTRRGFAADCGTRRRFVQKPRKPVPRDPSMSTSCASTSIPSPTTKGRSAT